MTRKITTLVLFSLLASAMEAAAQDSTQRQTPVEVTLIPAGATYFVKADDTGEPSFTNYDAGAALKYNVNRMIGVEGEVSGSFGFSQQLTFATFVRDATTPNLLQYSGNVVVSVPTEKSIVPFVTAGAGGLTLFDREGFIQRTNTFFTGNAGGGVKWRAGRWGVRADYRFLVVRRQEIETVSNERPRPDFFGKENRFGHRVFGGIILNIG